MKIFVVEGGIGRHVFFTALIPGLAGNEKIIVMSSYPDVFENNPYVYRSLSRGVPFTWNDLVKKPENQVVSRDPYFNDDFIKGKIHVIEAWARELGIEYTTDMKPELYITKQIRQAAKQFKAEQGQFIIVQFTCGQSPIGANLQAPFFYQGFERIYPLDKSQQLVKMIKDKYPSLAIVNFSIPNEGPDIEGSFRLQANYLFYAALLKESVGFVGVNSCLVHMAAAMDVKGVGIWGGSDPKQWGYDIHDNLYGECSEDSLFCTRPFLRDLGDFVGDGKKWSCSNPSCMDVPPEKILESLEKIMPDSVKAEIKKPVIKNQADRKCECRAS